MKKIAALVLLAGAGVGAAYLFRSFFTTRGTNDSATSTVVSSRWRPKV